MWDVETGETVVDLALEKPRLSPFFSPDGRYLIAGGGPEYYQFFRVRNLGQGLEPRAKRDEPV